MKPSRLSSTFLPVYNRTSVISPILSPPPLNHRRLHTAASNIPNTLQYLQSFRSLIESLSKNPRNYKALTTLDTFLAQTHCFTPATSVIVIDFLSQIKKLQRAKAVVHSLKCQGKVSDHFLYGLVFEFLVKDENFNAVETVWAEICGSDVRISASDYIIHVCKHGGVDEIKRVYEKVLMGGSVHLERQSLVALIGALCRVNEGSLAKELAGEMLDRGIAVDDLSYFVIFQCFCRNGDVDEADLILRKLWKTKFHFDVCIYGSFLHALCKSGKLREANKLFCRLIKRDSSEVSKKAAILKEGRRAIFQMSWEGAIPEIVAYEAYFRSLCSAGRINEAQELLKDMKKKRNSLEICIYGSFINALFRAGRAEDALKFFDVESYKGVIRMEDMARFVITGLCYDGRLDEALEIFNNGIACARTLNCILDGYWRARRVVEAERLFQRLQGGGFGYYNVSTYGTMINGYCNEGNVSKAVRLLDEMLSRKMSVNQTLYAMIIGGLCACGRVEQALQYFNAMVENGHAVSGKRCESLLHLLLNSDGMSSEL
ncbi:PREDICTED: pentatricopeptide repeat-containing protein At5g61990, mitochondrial-like [Ipomoea nil]|uniref:pentatricopeptide repeat-containing protein At5g61990, mitochondrial-like n=1 Tax=Ipomoea nil TaxID=35883 RepID=UPI000901FCE7|nr:PREDICTED: pentatricopeptide repeat-containing protein At5g61990, mitochondrial-like [Ipomoea nil]